MNAPRLAPGRHALARLGRRLGRGAPAIRVPRLPRTLLDLARSGPSPLAGHGPVDGPLRIAVVVPPFRRGSGGHATIVNLVRALGARGHAMSLWLEDHDGSHADVPADATARTFAEFFPGGPELTVGFAGWPGADVVLATGWQTVPRALLLPGCSVRAYLVQDHEPEFYGASAEAVCAAWTYRRGLHCIAASPWLAELLHDRYGASVSAFDLAVDQERHRPSEDARRGDLVVFYARAATPRRAVPLGLLALGELADRRPEIEIALFGDPRLDGITFPATQLGILAPAELAGLYARATVGVGFSLTNPSLVALEMMASGLACLELDMPATRRTFAAAGAPRLVAPDPLAICAEIEQLLDDAEARHRVAQAGLALMAGRTWAAAAEQVEQGLRAALAATG